MSFVLEMLLDILAGAEGALDVLGAGIAAVLIASIQVLHHPVQPPPEIVLGPPENEDDIDDNNDNYNDHLWA